MYQNLSRYASAAKLGPGKGTKTEFFAQKTIFEKPVILSKTSKSRILYKYFNRDRDRHRDAFSLDAFLRGAFSRDASSSNAFLLDEFSCNVSFSTSVIPFCVMPLILIPFRAIPFSVVTFP